MKTFGLCFVPLFVAVDAIGVLPIFVALTEQLAEGQRRKVVIQSVLTAAIVAQVGRSVEEVVALVENLRGRMQIRLVLDTLEYARRGGRLARLMPVIDRMCRALSIKPIIGMIEGELKLIGAARSLKGALQRIESEAANWGAIEQIAVAHTRLPDLVEEVARRLSENLHVMQESILIGEAGPAIGVHAGPGALGVVLVIKSTPTSM